MDNLEPEKVLEFIKLVHNLKHSARTGWVYSGIQNPETIASHMYVMAIMTFLLGSDSSLDRFRCLQLAVIHDLAECIVGDITPKDNMTPEAKHALEDVAMQNLTKNLSSEVGSIIYEIYKEYEAKQTPEAKFVKDLDRFDMIFTAAEYEKRDQTPGKLQEYFDSTDGKFEHSYVKKLAATLVQQRQTITRQS